MNQTIAKQRWIRLIPIAFITYSLAYLDRANYGFVWPFLLIGAVAFYISYAIGTQHFWISFILLVIAGGAMYAPYGPFFAIIPEILPRNVAGGAMALINSMGALGSFVGTYVVGYLNGATGGKGSL